MDDTPITLQEACELYGNRFKVATLRAEHERGRLDIFRIGKRDYTTPQAMREMVTKCREGDPRRASTSTQREKLGSSETDQRSAASERLNQAVQMLRSSSRATSQKSTPRPRATTR